MLMAVKKQLHLPVSAEFMLAILGRLNLWQNANP